MAVNSTAPFDPESLTDLTEGDELSRIVVAVDADTPDHVVERALAVAAAHDARVDALSVVRMTAAVDHWDMVVERREADAETALDAAGDTATDSNVPLTKQLRYGDPATEIAAYAADVDADLLVLGDPDHSRLRRLLTPPSVTTRVRQQTTTPTLAIPENRTPNEPTADVTYSDTSTA